MSTPVPEERRRLAEEAMARPDEDLQVEMTVDEKIHNDLLNYKSDKATRDQLKRSLAKQSMGG